MQSSKVSFTSVWLTALGKPGRLLWLAGLAAGLIFVLDWVTPPQYDVWILYVIPLLMAAGGPLRSLVLMGLLCTGLMAGSYWLTPSLPEAQGEMLNRSLGLGMLWLALALLARRQGVESALRQSEARFSALFHRNPVGMVLTRLTDQVMVDVNEAFAEIHGYQRQEMLGHAALDLQLWVNPAHRRAMLEQLAETGHCRNLEMQFRRKDGQLGYMLLSAERTDVSGVPHLLGSGNDITLRKQSEQALRDSEAKYRRLHESLRDALATADLSGKIIDCNPAFCALVGYSAEELRRMTYKDLTPESWQEAEAEIVTQQVLTRGYSGVYEKEYRRKDGQVFPVELRTFAILDEARTPTGMWAIVRDISERKRAEAALRLLAQRLRHAQDEEQRRIARELHDSTAQRLAAATMSLGRLEDLVAPASEQVQKLLHESLQLIEQCSQEVRTISYLLHPPFLEQLGLGPALRAYAEGFAKRSGIEVGIEIAPNLPRFSSEVELALFRVAQESLGNVYRHSGSRRAWLRLTNGGDLMLEIEDEGRGLPPEVLTAVRSTGVATGVGIAGMHERLDLVGGTLDITSSPGGTTVSAIVPVSLINNACHVE